MENVLNHRNLAFVILDFDKDDSIAHQNNDVRFTSTLATDDLIDTRRVIDIDNILQRAQSFAHSHFCFSGCLFGEIWFRICLEVTGFQPAVVTQDAHDSTEGCRVF